MVCKCHSFRCSRLDRKGRLSVHKESLAREVRSTSRYSRRRVGRKFHNSRCSNIHPVRRRLFRKALPPAARVDRMAAGNFPPTRCSDCSFRRNHNSRRSNIRPDRRFPDRTARRHKAPRNTALPRGRRCLRTAGNRSSLRCRGSPRRGCNRSAGRYRNNRPHPPSDRSHRSRRRIQNPRDTGCPRCHRTCRQARRAARSPGAA